MKMRFTTLGADGKVKGTYVMEYGDAPFELDDLGGYIMDDIRCLKLGESITVKMEEM